MIKNTIKPIVIGVVIAIVSGIILLDAPTLKSYIYDSFQWILATIISLWNKLFIAYSLPVWAWIIIFIFALIGLITIYIALRGEKKEPEYYSYTEDNLFNVKWQWHWAENKAIDIWCYCPNCEAILVYDDSSCRRLYEDCKTHFICENCNRSIMATILGGDKEYALGMISREINRRIRTGIYKNR